MSHEWDSGWLNEDAWHGLGSVRGVDGMPDRQPESMGELRKWAGVEWEPVEVPLYVPSALVVMMPQDTEVDRELAALLGEPAPVATTTSERTYVELEGWKAIVRSDNGHPLMAARPSRSLITNTDLAELCESTMGEIADGGVVVEGMMSLRGGGQVVIVTRMTDAFKVPGDSSENYSYATFGLGHDGSAGLSVFPTNIRVVCNNTWTAATARAEDEFGKGIVIRHTKSAKERIEQAKKVLSGMADARAKYLELMAELTGIHFENKLLGRFVEEFHPSPPSEVLISDRVANNLAEARAAVWAILNGPHCEGVRNTAYGCLMAATEYLDHVRRAKNGQTKFRRTMLRQEPLKERALVIIRELEKEVVA